jgi:hypothetical protein
MVLHVTLFMVIAWVINFGSCNCIYYYYCSLSSSCTWCVLYVSVLYKTEVNLFCFLQKLLICTVGNRKVADE